jgi:hypothetical protein
VAGTGQVQARLRIRAAAQHKPATGLAGELADHQRQVPELGQRGARGFLVTGSRGEVVPVGFQQARGCLLGEGGREPSVQAGQVVVDQCAHGAGSRMALTAEAKSRQAARSPASRRRPAGVSS